MMNRVPWGVRVRGEVRAVLSRLGLVRDRGTWLQEGKVFACAFPRTEAALASLAEQGVRVVINLHERRRHAPTHLRRYGLTEVHLPVPDFSAPSPEIIDTAIEVLRRALREGDGVAVHCGGGLGRTGTLLACCLLDSDPALSADAAMAAIRAKRPGSIETVAQEEAVRAYADRRR